ncbi:hypothetical protein DL766_007760 [Monosporascus sp. MC13-8B]|uniref:MARVEL domain-containing protein n=1 Tax=Monosporascus cannonballus TaxID=155416 RepID=A0ABY0HJN1_9PEZI|nr:hypothetical protein DL762_000780 [Monosporascus cannonballus]RYO96401.1 hypothetical protein DL763_003257 [Monosporascus cannonballus]RYP22230.1 hypothetical protein DL766_007760 [Monosporascus sp. MC13-8B]
MFEADFFDPSYKFRVHLIQVFLVVVGIIIALVAMSIPGGFMTRAHIMAMSMGFKTLIIISYQLLTGHMARFSKWKSLKAYAILNCVEVVLWAVAFVMTIQSNNRICIGVTCSLSKFLAANAVFNVVLMLWAAICSVMDFRHFKSTGYERGTPYSK